MREIAAGYASASAGIAALIFFFAFFVAAALWVFRPGSGSIYRQDAQIPFKD